MTRPCLAFALVLLPLAALAQAPAKGPNGGRLVDAEGHGVELVTNGTELVIYLTDEDKKPTAAHPGARAVVQDGGRTTTIPLTPQAPNRLVGVLPAPLGAGARVVVSAKLVEGHTIQARFAR